MRHNRLFAVITAFTLLLAGCGPDDGGDSAFNPATNVDLVFSTFDLTDVEGRPSNLEHTRFRDFYRGIEPADPGNADARALADALRSHIDVFIGGVRSANGIDYNRVRNPLDLMNQVIASAEVTNFQEGRSYISDRIDAGEAATYNTRPAGALIRFTDQQATLARAALADRVWLYQTLAWTYNPLGPDNEPGFEKVYRTIQYVAQPAADDETAEPPELVSLLAGSQFDATSFSAFGYNRPEFATVDYLSRSYGSMELRQEFSGLKTDTLYLSNTKGLTVAGQNPDCVLVTLDYPQAELVVFMSEGEPATLTSGADNPAHCSHQVPGEEWLRYATVAVAERQ